MNYDATMMGDIIRRLRIEKNLTQDVLSGLAGIARSHLSMIEGGIKSANVDTLWRIAHELDIKLSALIMELEKRMETIE